MRIVCRFSCGAASAVATKLALAHYPRDQVVISYSDTNSEHPDNTRFMADCVRWFNHPITVHKSEKYKDIWDVWEKRRFMKGKDGAPCTGEMKRAPSYAFSRPNDVLVMGYTKGEEERVARIRATNFETKIIAPLIDAGLDKAGCLAILERAGIALPAMYLLGFNNNNCIGCPKGGRGYWNMIRKHFPDTFNRVAKLQRELGPNHGFWPEPDGSRLMLDQLDPNRGVQQDDPVIECGVVCEAVETYIGDTP